MFSVHETLTLIAALVLLSTSMIVLTRDYRSRSHQLMAIFLFILFIWAIMDLIGMMSSSDEVVGFTMDAITAAVIFVPPLILHISHVFPWRKRKTPFIITVLYAVSFIILAVHLNTSLFVEGFYDIGDTHITQTGPAGIALYIYVAVASFLAMAVLIVRYTRTNGEFILKKMRYLILGISIAVILTAFTEIPPLIEGISYRSEITSLSFALSSLIFLMAFLEPMPKVSVGSGSGGTAKGGEQRVIELPKDEAYPLFFQLIKEGRNCICLTGRSRREMQEEIGMDDVPVLSVDDIVGEHREDVADMLYFAITDSMEDGNTVALLDSMEQAIGKAELNALIQSFRDSTGHNNTILVVR